MAALGALVITAPAQASFAPEGSPLAVGAAQPYGVVPADFNGDGRLDAATVNGTGSNLSVFLRGPSGFAAEAGSPFATGPGPGYGVAADFNGDGLPDVATQNFNNGTVSVLLRQPGGGFAAGPTLSVGAGTGSVTAADFNGDGRLDIAAPSYTNSNILTYLNNGTGFTQEGDQPHRRHAPRRRGRRLQRRRAAGPRHLQPRRRLGHRPLAQRRRNTGFASEAAAIPVGASPEGIEAADFNGDGRPDIAVAVLGTNTVNVLLRNPGGGFTAEAPIPVGAGALGLADGRLQRRRASRPRGDQQHRRHGHGAAAPGGRRLRGRRRAAPGAGRQRRRRGRLQRRRQAGPRGLQRPGQHAHRVPQHDRAGGARRRPQPAAPASARPGQVGRRARRVGQGAHQVPGRQGAARRQHDEFVPLTGAVNIPVGSALDTTKGRIALTSAADTAGKKTQTAEFYDGIFQVKQSVPKKKPKKPAALITDLVMKDQIARSQCAPLKGARSAARRQEEGPEGGARASCGAAARASSAPTASTAPPRSAARSGSCRTAATAR